MCVCVCVCTRWFCCEGEKRDWQLEVYNDPNNYSGAAKFLRMTAQSCLDIIYIHIHAMHIHVHVCDADKDRD